MKIMHKENVLAFMDSTSCVELIYVQMNLKFVEKMGR
jgi:hypothetical protein